MRALFYLAITPHTCNQLCDRRQNMQETPQQYTQRMLGYVNGKDPLRIQKETAKKLQRLTKPLSKRQLARQPAPGKWSIAQIMAHLADAELVGGWRMRSVLANNGTSLQPFDQDAWAETLGYSRRDAKTSLEMFRVLRENNLTLLKTVPKNLLENYGMHSERGRETISHFNNLVAGHDLNHLQQVETIVKALRTRKR